VSPALMRASRHIILSFLKRLGDGLDAHRRPIYVHGEVQQSILCVGFLQYWHHACVVHIVAHPIV
jgi:hypothetical protein